MAYHCASHDIRSSRGGVVPTQPEGPRGRLADACWQQAQVARGDCLIDNGTVEAGASASREINRKGSVISADRMGMPAFGSVRRRFDCYPCQARSSVHENNWPLAAFSG